MQIQTHSPEQTQTQEFCSHQILFLGAVCISLLRSERPKHVETHVPMDVVPIAVHMESIPCRSLVNVIDSLHVIIRAKLNGLSFTFC